MTLGEFRLNLVKLAEDCWGDNVPDEELQSRVASLVTTANAVDSPLIAHQYETQIKSELDDFKVMLDTEGGCPECEECVDSILDLIDGEAP